MEATDATIKAAFNHQMRGASPKRLKELQQARGLLLRQPEERALLGLFFYDLEAASLDPNPAKDPEALCADRRAETARRWTAQFRKAFPDDQKAHALAILWYWNALRDQGRLETALTAGESAETLNKLGEATLAGWKYAGAYWAMALATPAFWKARALIPAEQRQTVCERLIETRLRHPLRELEHHCRAAGATGLARDVEALRVDLDSEIEIARRLAQSGIGLHRRRVACGPLLLGLHGILEKMRDQVAQASAKKPEDPGLRGLREALSPLAPIQRMIEEGRFETALEAIAKQPSSPAIADLAIAAYRALGEQQEEMDRFEEALEYWRQAKQAAETAGLLPPDWLPERVTRLAEQALQRLAEPSAQERLLAILELAVALVALPQLEAQRNVRLGQRAWEAFLADVKTWQEGHRDHAILDRLIENLGVLEKVETAEAESRQQAEQARAWMIGIGQYPGLPEEVRRLVTEAEEAAAAEDWEPACIALFGALEATDQDRIRQSLRNKLAVRLNNYSMKQFNAAAERVAALHDIDDILQAFQEEWEAVLGLEQAVALDPENASIRQVHDGVIDSTNHLARQIEQIGQTLALQKTRQKAEKAWTRRLEQWKKSGAKKAAAGSSAKLRKQPAATETLSPAIDESPGETSAGTRKTRPGQALAGWTMILVGAAAGMLAAHWDWHWAGCLVLGILSGLFWFGLWEKWSSFRPQAAKPLSWASLAAALIGFFLPLLQSPEPFRVLSRPPEETRQAGADDPQAVAPATPTGAASPAVLPLPGRREEATESARQARRREEAAESARQARRRKEAAEEQAERARQAAIADDLRHGRWDATVVRFDQWSRTERQHPELKRLGFQAYEGSLQAAEQALDGARPAEAQILLDTAERISMRFDGFSRSRLDALYQRLAAASRPAPSAASSWHGPAIMEIRPLESPASGEPGNLDPRPKTAPPSPEFVRSEVLTIQRALHHLGYNPGPVDGDFGSRTRSAILRYQQDTGLAADGLPSSSLAQTLRHHSAWYRPVRTAPPPETASLAALRNPRPSRPPTTAAQPASSRPSGKGLVVGADQNLVYGLLGFPESRRKNASDDTEQMRYSDCVVTLRYGRVTHWQGSGCRLQARR